VLGVTPAADRIPSCNGIVAIAAVFDPVVATNDCYYENCFLEDNKNKMYCLECDTAWIGICYAQCHPSTL
jgi:hypothetical protein